MLCSLIARPVSSAVSSSSRVNYRQFGAIMSSTSKLYPPADISKQTVLVTGAERQISCATS